MSDPILPPGPSGDGSPPANATGPSIQVLAQYVKDLSFENPNAPQSLQPSQNAPQVMVNIDVRTRPIQGDTLFEVVLNVRGEAKQGELATFIIELAYGGLVALSGVPREHTTPVLLIDVPHLLFPFARSVIAEATRNGGFPPLLIQPIDFGELFRRQMQNQAGAAPADGATTGPKPPTVN